MHRQISQLIVIILFVLPLQRALSAPAASLGEFDDHRDIGKVDRPGAAEYDAATKQYRVTGSGENIWAKADAFHFLFKRISGDVTLSADVKFAGEGKVAHRKACLMVRQGLEADDPYADVAVHGDGLISLQYRREKGGATMEVQSPVKGPATVLLQRDGDVFTLSITPAGKPQIRVGSVTVALHDPVYAGIAVCSHDPAVSETAVLSNLSFKTSVVPPNKKRVQ
jgi:hypothetical protein